jgi:hypothetical protein
MIHHISTSRVARITAHETLASLIFFLRQDLDVAQAALELTMKRRLPQHQDPTAAASEVLGLQACTTITCSYVF